MEPYVETIFSYKDTRGTLNELGDWGPQFPINVKWSSSKKGVVRGLHWQHGKSQQKKYISVISGKIFDVCLNLETQKIYTFDICSKQKNRLFVPAGYAHGFQALEENTIVLYASSPGYDQKSERAVSPLIITRFGIDWPLTPLMSEKDTYAPKQLDNYLL